VRHLARLREIAAEPDEVCKDAVVGRASVGDPLDGALASTLRGPQGRGVPIRQRD
jgi:hypothetical protein